MFDAGAFVATEPDHDSTCLHIAAEKGFVDVIERLLEADGRCAINRFDYISHTPLMWAAMNRNLAAARCLIAASADVNANDGAHIGDTALHVAVFNGNYDMVKLLLESGADPLTPGWMMLTPLDKAIDLKGPEHGRILALLQQYAGRRT